MVVVNVEYTIDKNYCSKMVKPFVDENHLASDTVFTRQYMRQCVATVRNDLKSKGYFNGKVLRVKQLRKGR